MHGAYRSGTASHFARGRFVPVIACRPLRRSSCCGKLPTEPAFLPVGFLRNVPPRFVGAAFLKGVRPCRNQRKRGKS